MKICDKHWKMCRKAVEEYGMGRLTKRGIKEAPEARLDQLAKYEPGVAFDPMLNMHWHYCKKLIECGGFQYVAVKDCCPLCEFEDRQKRFKAKKAIYNTAAVMSQWARESGLIPQLQ